MAEYNWTWKTDGTLTGQGPVILGAALRTTFGTFEVTLTPKGYVMFGCGKDKRLKVSSLEDAIMQANAIIAERCRELLAFVTGAQG